MKAAIVGAGKVAKEHARAYQANGIEVVAVMSRTKEGAKQAIEAWGLKEAEAHNAIEGICALDNVDVVSVCSPPEVHASQVIALAGAGKHMAIEKPVALSRGSLYKMCEAVDDAGVCTVVGFVLRWNSLVQTIVERTGELGLINEIHTGYWHGSCREKEHSVHEYGTRKVPIGAMVGGGCHAMDMARYLVGTDIVSVSARAVSDADGRQHTNVALVEFGEGMIGTVSATDSVFMPYWFEMRIFGSDGAIREDNQICSRKLAKDGYDWAVVPGVVPDSGAVWHHPFQSMIKELKASVQADVETCCPLSDAVNVHLACFAAELSAKRDGRVIEVDESL